LEKSYNSGSWKYGKGSAFTHIPTNFMILIKKKHLLIIKKNRGKKYDDKKSFK